MIAASAPGAAPPEVPPRDRAFYVVNAVVSAVALGTIAWLLLLRRPPGGGLDLGFMPGVNAALNSVSAVLLTAGWVAIRRRRIAQHRTFMVAATISSGLFLLGYLAYHYVHGDTKYAGDGALRVAYLLILATHVLASMVVVPLVFSALYFAWRRRFAAHRRVTRVLWPLWMYVSVTGVVVYFMLHGFAPAAAALPPGGSGGAG